MSQLLASQKLRNALAQGLFLAVVVLVTATLIVTGRNNIAAQGIATGFGFLERTTGWPVNFSLIEISAKSTYARVLWAGLLNTMLVGFLTLFFATLFGLILAFMRISSNTLMRFVGTTYIEVFRNVPVILQVFFWYALLTHLPSPKEAYELAGLGYFSNRGLMLAVPNFTGMDLVILLALVALLAIWLIYGKKIGPSQRRGLIALGIFCVAFLVLLLTGREPGQGLISAPELKGLRFVGGLTLKPEFSALLIGLVLFGAAYIGEIIRGGLLAVDRGKLEAGSALGLSNLQVNRYVRIPLAFRAMLPSLSNQYVWLMKATTVGIAIGYPDYFAIVSTSINQAGQTMELIALLMGGFLVLNYSIGFVMNVLNDRFKLKGRS
jgi:general L-amino acid transport system permease protein